MYFKLNEEFQLTKSKEALTDIDTSKSFSIKLEIYVIDVPTSKSFSNFKLIK